MFSKSYYRLMVSSIIILIALTLSSQAQMREGNWGISSGMAMPSGITTTAGLPTNVLSQLNISYSASSNFIYVVSPMMQLEAGLGYVSIGYTVPSGQTAASSQSALSIMVGGKYFLRQSDVNPYLGVNFSFSQLPTITNGGNSIKGKLITAIGYFGAQGFINSAKTVALFVQFGLGYNTGTLTTTVGSNSFDNGINTFNLGGSAFGGMIYF